MHSSYQCVDLRACVAYAWHARMRAREEVLRRCCAPQAVAERIREDAAELALGRVGVAVERLEARRRHGRPVVRRRRGLALTPEGVAPVVELEVGHVAKHHVILREAVFEPAPVSRL